MTTMVAAKEADMMIELDTVQRDLVTAMLSNRLANLSSEIRHTDTPRFRQELREEREVLRSILVKLEELAA